MATRLILSILTAVVLVSGLIAPAPAGRAWAADDQEPSMLTFEASVERTLADQSYQTELPAEEAAPDPPAEWKWPKWLVTGLNWLAAGVGAALILYVIYVLARDHWMSRGGGESHQPIRETKPASKPSVRAPARGDRPSAAKAEAEAEQGRFLEAVHLLLLTALRLVEGRASRRFPPASTSREILTGPGIEDDDMVALEILVQHVERGLFACQKVCRPDYEKCRVAFDMLTRQPVADSK